MITSAWELDSLQSLFFNFYEVAEVFTAETSSSIANFKELHRLNTTLGQKSTKALYVFKNLHNSVVDYSYFLAYYLNNLYAYVYTVVYVKTTVQLYTPSKFVFFYLWYNSIFFNENVLHFCATLDFLNTVQTSSLFKNLPIASSQNSMFILFVNELILAKTKLLSEYSISLSEVRVSAHTNFTGVLFFAFFTFVGLYFLIVGYYLVFNLKNKYFMSEAYYDFYYSTASLSVESEKEITNLDDMFVPVCFLVFIFGWFFGLFLVVSLVININSYIVYAGFILLFLVVFFMPMNILYDCGVLFSGYLRGSSSSVILFAELMYDTLATTIMFVRLFVQNIRFVLMFVAYVEIFELIETFSVDYECDLIVDTNKSYEHMDIMPHTSGLTLTLFYETPLFILKYLYQTAHLIFVFTSHFSAYLALVFWLFSFLYTCFVDEKVEFHFKFLREKYARLQKK